MTLIIRKAKEEDLAALSKLALEDSALSREQAQALLVYKANYTLFVVLNNSGLAAGFSLLIMDNLAHEGSPSGMLDDLLIAPSDLSNDRLVNAILSFSLEQCSKQGCYKLCVANPSLLPPLPLSSEDSPFSQHGLCFVKPLSTKVKPFSLLSFGVQLREASKADLAAILALYQQPGMDDKVLALEAAQALYLKMVGDPHYKIYVALAGKELIGTFALLMVPSLMQQKRSLAIVEDVMVSPAAQGKGVGKLMINFALELAEKENCYKLALSSNKKRENAHSFYRALGFIESGASLLVHARISAPVEELDSLVSSIAP